MPLSCLVGMRRTRKRRATRSRKLVEDRLHLRLTDDLRAGENEASRDAVGMQSHSGVRRLTGGQFSDSLLDGMKFSERQSWQFGDDFARAHGARMLGDGCGVKCPDASRRAWRSQRLMTKPCSRTRRCAIFLAVSTLAEIESAVDALPVAQQKELFRHLAERLNTLDEPKRRLPVVPAIGSPITQTEIDDALGADWNGSAQEGFAVMVSVR